MNSSLQNHSYPPSSAGRVIITRVPVASINNRISDIEKILLQKTKDFETINYVYLVDNQYKLKGVISIKEIFRQPKDTLVSQVMKSDLTTVRLHTNQERVAYLAVKHNIKALPVTDKEGKFLGIVSSDNILAAIYNSTSETLLTFAGIHQPEIVIDNILKLSLFQSFQHRFPWLFIGLIGGIIAAKIVGIFEKTLAQNLILAAFIPLIVYMAGAMVTQMQAFIIRDFSIDPKLNFKKYFFKQLSISFFIAAGSGLALYSISFIFYQNAAIGFVLSVALFCAMLSSVINGLIAPYLFRKLKVDPANASGPLAAIVQDILSVFIYLTIASWLL